MEGRAAVVVERRRDRRRRRRRDVAVGAAREPPLLSLPRDQNPQHSHSPKSKQPTKQMYHWGEKRRIATFYKELAEKEAAEEAAHDAVVAEKMAALKAELLK